MSGQVGSTRARIEYETNSDTLTGGIRAKLSSSFEVSFNAAWNRADGAMAPFELVVPADYLAANVNQSFDFTRTYLNSDLETDRFEVELGASYEIGERLAIHGAYRSIELDDEAPYLVDLSGSADFFTVGLSLRF